MRVAPRHTRAGARIQVPADVTRDRGARASVAVKPFQVRGRFMTAIALRIESDQFDDAFFEAIDAQITKAPQLLLDAPLVLDFSKVPEFADSAALADLVAKLRTRNMLVFGVQNTTSPQLEAADGLGLIPVRIGRDGPAPEAKPARKSKVDRLLPPDNKVITKPVRSGQLVVAERGDLTVIGPVSSGAELVAAGNIHVYGPLRGRAMAGCHGDETGRIFCRALHAELLAVAGLYRTSESIEDELRGQAVQIFLKDERLCVEALG
ncbi:septum site-determining protein MinC [Salipiger bermudensis]|uniref:septum site-determining protein MinC n=1 Tax=Salipiger bermudensis TaxID=344736 RepID=UPI0021E5DF80